MKTYPALAGPATLAILAAGSLLIPTTLRAVGSAEVTKLLSDVKAEATELKDDSSDMESFTRSRLSWPSYGSKLEMIKGHVNNALTLLAKLKSAEATGSQWQQTAIKRIEPLLKELADNTTATINHLNDNQGSVHMPAFTDFVKANYALAKDLEALIRDFVDYEDAKEKFESLGSKSEASR